MRRETKFILIRHGESEANVANCINDDPARIVNLTARGRAQAEQAALALGAVHFTHAYASEFARARQTAEILLRGQACTLGIDARLNERRSGMDGLPVYIFNDFVSGDPLRIRPPRGESFLEQMERVRSFLDEAASHHGGGTVLAVSHENPILAAVALTENDAERVVHTNIANCAWVELNWPAD